MEHRVPNEGARESTQGAEGVLCPSIGEGQDWEWEWVGWGAGEEGRG
ncbi:hypothetical protein T4B_5236 [Trichinella pseudospiralis]|uniref:Uncharacterized protein n=1 Tax=Trichinella pseudospiralis TaxID=6337 RepID=A0A0V1GD08_TRIPS|nr:hypothetical protein T4B_5236 [Trichinella pseudospiralis]